MATQTKDQIKPTFTFTPLEVGRLGRPSRLRRAVLMGLSHFLTSKGFTQHHFYPAPFLKFSNTPNLIIDTNNKQLSRRYNISAERCWVYVLCIPY